MKYFIWSDGEEHGPYEFDQLYESWKEGTLPQGFLWRRESDATFSIPDALEAEHHARRNHSKTPPTGNPEAEPTSGSKEDSKPPKVYELRISSFSGALANVVMFAGFVAAFVNFQFGSILISIGFVILFTAWAMAVLHGLASIVNRLDAIYRSGAMGRKANGR